MLFLGEIGCLGRKDFAALAREWEEALRGPRSFGPPPTRVGAVGRKFWLKQWSFNLISYVFTRFETPGSLEKEKFAPL